MIDGTIRERGIIDVDEAKQPMTIDFIIEAGAPPNTIQRDLIESEGDTLRLHVELGSGVRPRDFTPGEDTLLIAATRKVS